MPIGEVVFSISSEGTDRVNCDSRPRWITRYLDVDRAALSVAAARAAASRGGHQIACGGRPVRARFAEPAVRAHSLTTSASARQLGARCTT